jgi:hypothetical protein
MSAVVHSCLTPELIHGGSGTRPTALTKKYAVLGESACPAVVSWRFVGRRPIGTKQMPAKAKIVAKTNTNRVIVRRIVMIVDESDRNIGG